MNGQLTAGYAVVIVIIALLIVLAISESGIFTEKVKQDIPQVGEISAWAKTNIECDTTMDCVDSYKGLLTQAGESIPEKTLIEKLRCANKICEVKI